MISKKIFLFIDTASHKNINISIIDEMDNSLSFVDYSSNYQFKIKDKLLVSIEKLIKLVPGKNRIKGVVCVVRSKEMTSLRIGVSTANAFAYSRTLPIVGVQDKGNIKKALKKLRTLKKFKPVVPIYEINPMLK